MGTHKKKLNRTSEGPDLNRVNAYLTLVTLFPGIRTKLTHCYLLKAEINWFLVIDFACLLYEEWVVYQIIKVLCFLELLKLEKANYLLSLALSPTQTKLIQVLLDPKVFSFSKMLCHVMHERCLQFLWRINQKLIAKPNPHGQEHSVHVPQL